MKFISRFLKKFPISITLILVFAAIIRLATLGKLMVFTPDEEYLLYIVQTLVKHFHIIWIGVSALGFDFYMGPGWIYFIYPFIAIARGDPIVIGVIASVFGIVTCWLIYWFGKKLFNQRVGIISAIIYAASALIVYYDQQPYPTGVPLLSLGLAISLYLTRESKKWWILFAFLYGIVFHIHLSLVLIIFVGLYWALANRKMIDRNTIALSVLAFLVAISPLIAFDYFHKGSNITAPIRVIEAMGKNTTKLDLGYRLGTLAKTFSRIWVLDLGKSNTDEILYPCNSYPGNNSTKVKWGTAILTVVMITVFVSRKDIWKDEKKRLLLLLSLAFLAPFIFLASIGSVEYYLLGFFPILIIMVAWTIDSFSKPLRYISYIGLGLFVIYNSMTVLSASGDYGLMTKKALVGQVMEVVGNSPYELSEEGGTCQGAAGWRYLFLIYGRRPERSSEDKIFSWLWPTEVTKTKTKYSIVMEETRSPVAKQSSYKTKINEGGFTAYIYESK